MSFSTIPAEIRLQIYSELLVRSEPIVFIADYGRVNRMMRREASPLLYSSNCFRFPAIYPDWPEETTAHIAFLDQIGSQARLIRRISMALLALGYPPTASNEFDEADIEQLEADVKALELIRDACTGIQTFELLLPGWGIALNCSANAKEALTILDTRLKSFPSLQEITVNLDLAADEHLNDDVLETMHRYGWIVKLRELPKRRLYPRR
ncbi:MAG: hypothetical protein LQ352_004275 [Teloschistes flavicans]|nr:MAG: hypothetical protein LQ352_004275 [Teloschistes flavicans]